MRKKKKLPSNDVNEQTMNERKIKVNSTSKNWTIFHYTKLVTLLRTSWYMWRRFICIDNTKLLRYACCSHVLSIRMSKNRMCVKSLVPFFFHSLLSTNGFFFFFMLSCVYKRTVDRNSICLLKQEEMMFSGSVLPTTTKNELTHKRIQKHTHSLTHSRTHNLTICANSI